MRACRLFGPRDLRVIEEPMPTIASGQALLRVRSVTVCHSDIHYYRDARIGDTVSDTALVLGHEFAAEVVDVARDVTRVQVGDHVAVEPAISCGTCHYCLQGDPNFCDHLLFSGTPPLDGALREYMPYEARFLFPLPESLGFDDGALLEPLGVALYACDLAAARLGDAVAVVGCGPIGLLVVQLALLAGAFPVIAVEPLAHRRALAKEMGAAALSPDADLEQRVRDLTGGHGVHAAIEVAGTLDGQEEAARIVRKGGTIVAVGIPPEDQLAMTHHVIRRKGVTIKLARRMKHTYPRAIAAVTRGDVDLAPLLTHTFGIEEADAAFRLVESYGDKVLKAAIHP